MNRRGQLEGPQRYYASEHYLLPADMNESARLDAQHRSIVRAFENRLSLIPMTNFKTGDRVLESAAGTGIWAIDFFETNANKGVILDIECTDLSDRQFHKLQGHPNIHYSLHSVTDFPAEWTDRFAYIHQRFLVVALNESLWQQAVNEMFRTLSPGGWLELVEMDLKNWLFNVGPYSKKIHSLMFALYAEKGIVIDLPAYLPPLLEKAGFVDIQCEARALPIGSLPDKAYRSEEFGAGCRGLMGPLLEYGLIETEEEYENMVQESVREWDSSNEASLACFTVIARKPY
ncbi:hypothetical protein D9757_009708 [Collybiopsis confluens]|uniref:S-adenosyl-L-methionine-dependent methyltransferase n=1 Tax=Collybiopsis confluens TaxID=2823264 RepID=A0A8H5M1H1_9AGAR|nr:hypothetical protein D9757_009708 [Collybiopsis confluens]